MSTDNFVASSFTFTINNYTEENIASLKAIPCLRCVAGYEVAPTTGTPHIQGAIMFAKPMRRDAFKKVIGFTSNCDKMLGPWSSQAYCCKDGAICRMTDTDNQQGKRNDIVAMKDAAKRGASDMELIDEHTAIMAKWPKFANTVRHTFRKIEPLPLGTKGTIGLWLWSSKGNTGKTTWAETKWPDAYDKMDNRFFDNYNGEEVIIWDDPVQKTIGQSMMGYLKKWCNEK